MEQWMAARSVTRVLWGRNGVVDGASLASLRSARSAILGKPPLFALGEQWGSGWRLARLASLGSLGDQGALGEKWDSRWRLARLASLGSPGDPWKTAPVQI